MTNFREPRAEFCFKKGMKVLHEQGARLLKRVEALHHGIGNALAAFAWEREDIVDRGRCSAKAYSVRCTACFAPRDFDLSPYFKIVKPMIETGLIHTG
jgi:hypothetical protein